MKKLFWGIAAMLTLAVVIAAAAWIADFRAEMRKGSVAPQDIGTMFNGRR